MNIICSLAHNTSGLEGMGPISPVLFCLDERDNYIYGGGHIIITRTGGGHIMPPPVFRKKKLENGGAKRRQIWHTWAQFKKTPCVQIFTFELWSKGQVSKSGQSDVHLVTGFKLQPRVVGTVVVRMI